MYTDVESLNIAVTTDNDEKGNVAFDPIAYSFDDADKTYKYTIEEVDDGQEGITYDTHIENVTVTVERNGTEPLRTEVKYGSGKPPVFENKRTGSGGGTPDSSTDDDVNPDSQEKVVRTAPDRNDKAKDEKKDGSHSTRTGDDVQIALLVVLVAFSLATPAVFMRRRRLRD